MANTPPDDDNLARYKASLYFRNARRIAGGISGDDGEMDLLINAVESYKRDKNPDSLAARAYNAREAISAVIKTKGIAAADIIKAINKVLYDFGVRFSHPELGDGSIITIEPEESQLPTKNSGQPIFAFQPRNNPEKQIILGDDRDISFLTFVEGPTIIEGRKSNPPARG